MVTIVAGWFVLASVMVILKKMNQISKSDSKIESWSPNRTSQPPIIFEYFVTHRQSRHTVYLKNARKPQKIDTANDDHRP